MADEYKGKNQNQKDFTKKYNKDEIKVYTKEDKEVKEVKTETADLKFNSQSLATPKVEAKVEKTEEVKPEIKSEVKIEAETKVESKVETPIRPVKAKVSGKVVTVGKSSYTVITSDGKGVAVHGKHNKKVGDIV